MKWVAFFLLVLTLAAGCVLEDKPVDPGIDGGIDGGMCNPPCTDDAPVCNSESNCVELDACATSPICMFMSVLLLRL